MEKKNELMEEKLANLKLSKPLFFRLVNLLKKLTGWFEKLLVAGMKTILCVDVQTIERDGVSVFVSEAFLSSFFTYEYIK